MLKVKEDSMIDAAIYVGDSVNIRGQKRCEKGEILGQATGVLQSVR